MVEIPGCEVRELFLRVVRGQSTRVRPEILTYGNLGDLAARRVFSLCIGSLTKKALSILGRGQRAENIGSLEANQRR